MNPLAGYAGTDTPVRAAPEPTPQVKKYEDALVQFAEKSWRELKQCIDARRDPCTLKNATSLWNNVKAALLVSDESGSTALADVRVDILSYGARSALVPPDVVHTALFTAYKFGQAISPSAQTEIAEAAEGKLRKAIIPYLGKVLADLHPDGRPPERQLFAPAHIEEVMKSWGAKARIYQDKEFMALQSAALASLLDSKTLGALAQEFSRNPCAGSIFETLCAASAHGALPRAAIESAYSAIFGEAQGKSLAQSPPIETPQEPAEQAPLSIARGALPDMLGRSEEQRSFCAQNILLLAHQGDPLALSAASQWFGAKANAALSGDARGAQFGASDFAVLEALAVLAHDSAAARETLRRIAATFPEQVLFDVVIRGGNSLVSSPQSDAAKALRATFDAHIEETEHWLGELALGSAPSLADSGMARAPASDEEYARARELRNASRRAVSLFLAAIDARNNFATHFREVLDNPFASRTDVAISVSALGLARDKEAMERLLEIGADQTAERSIRSLALWAAIHSDSIELLPQSQRAQFGRQSALTVSHPSCEHIAAALSPQSIEEIVQENPFLARIEGRLNDWMDSRTRIGADLPQTSAPPSDSERVAMFLALTGQEFSASSGAIAGLHASQGGLNGKSLPTLHDSLQAGADSRLTLDLELAIPAIEILSRAGFTPAEKTLIDIASRPEEYARSKSLGGMLGLSFNAHEGLLLKAYALKSLGGVCELHAADGAGARALHQVLRKDSSALFRESSVHSLNVLAERCARALATAHDAQERDTIARARERHVQELLQTLQLFRSSIEEDSQARLRAMSQEYSLVRLIDKFGGTNEVVRLALQEARKSTPSYEGSSEASPRDEARSSLVRSVFHALISNGKTASDVAALSLSAHDRDFAVSLYDYVASQRFWLGAAREALPRGTHAGVAIIDAGLVLPNPIMPSLAERVQYPSGTSWEDFVRTDSFHPTAVAGAVHSVAPDAIIYSFDGFNESAREHGRPATSNDAVLRSLESIAEMQLSGKADIDVINYSFGWKNLVLQDNEARAQLTDFAGAYMEILSAFGVKHSVAAGNSHGDDPRGARFGSLGELNNLGMRVNEDDTVSKVPGVFYAGAEDAYAGRRVAEFSSQQEVLRQSELERFASFHGVHVLLPWEEYGQWMLTPLNGTSFAAPHQSAVFAMVEAALSPQGDGDVSAREVDDIIAQCMISVPFHQGFEGGYYVSVGKLVEILKNRSGNDTSDSMPGRFAHGGSD